ncbi:hypothetical protein [Lactiplantibacillus daowaiensis]|uniref:Uncharacterized protein n=1 Tax=Lactiplantibacillus daowaiensis TaxID=2559918 RepID=A0ABW1S3N2_9LACO|nr:hypothetical protein [Lactiplantibacillus daowaiensis]
MLATVKLTNDLIVSQTVIVDGEITYQIKLQRRRWLPTCYQLRLTATTLLGTITVQRLNFTDLAVAQAAFDHQQVTLTAN